MRQELRMSQQLVMTPQLQQAIRLLQMPLLELNTQIAQALAENVMLESEEPEDVTASTAEQAALAEGPTVVGRTEETGAWQEYPSAGARGETWSDDTRRPELADRSTPGEWEAEGSPEIRERAGHRVKSILSTHYPEYIDPAIDRKIRDSYPILLPPEVMKPSSGRW